MKNGWKNIWLVQSDAAKYSFPAYINGVFSTFALTLVPDYQAVVEQVSKALVDGGRFVILDSKKPERWPLWIVKFEVTITRLFGVTLNLSERKPWEVMKTCFRNVTVTDLYGGFVYIAIREK